MLNLDDAIANVYAAAASRVRGLYAYYIERHIEPFIVKVDPVSSLNSLPCWVSGPAQLIIIRDPACEPSVQGVSIIYASLIINLKKLGELYPKFEINK